jgi:hypothetical protein
LLAAPWQNIGSPCKFPPSIFGNRFNPSSFS